MRIGITGGEGFIGSHLRRFFAKQGHKVSFLDKKGVDFINPNQAALRRFVIGKDLIIHAAGINRGTDTEIISGNIIAAHNLLLVMGRFRSPAKLIFLSSIQAALENIYGQSKKLAEIIFRDYSLKKGKFVSVLRLPNIFGENSRPFYNSAVATFCYQAANNKPLSIDPANRKKKIPLLYVENLAEIINQEMAKMPKTGFNLKTIKPEKEISVGALADLIAGFANGSKSKTAFDKNLYKTFLSFKK